MGGSRGPQTRHRDPVEGISEFSVCSYLYPKVVCAIQVSSKNCADPVMVARAWVKAVEMAIKFLGEEEAAQIAKSYGM